MRRVSRERADRPRSSVWATNSALTVFAVFACLAATFLSLNTREPAKVEENANEHQFCICTRRRARSGCFRERDRRRNHLSLAFDQGKWHFRERSLERGRRRIGSRR